MAAIETDENGIRSYILDDGTSLIENVKKLGDLRVNTQYVVINWTTEEGGNSGRFYESANLEDATVIENIKDVFSKFPHQLGFGFVEVTYNDGSRVVAKNLNGGAGLDLYYDDALDVIQVPRLIN